MHKQKEFAVVKAYRAMVRPFLSEEPWLYIERDADIVGAAEHINPGDHEPAERIVERMLEFERGLD